MNDQDCKPYVTILGSDPYDEREGPYFSREDLEYMRRLPPGTKMTVVNAKEKESVTVSPSVHGE